MDDAELTRLAIAEIVREMGELKELPVQERKINPIAKPNKRFLGRTLNSVMSHNKRENDRTQENCRKKLRELDERRGRKYSKSRSSSGDLVLSSSTDGDRRRNSMKRRKKRKKTISRKQKKVRKVKNKSKKRKSNRRENSSSSSSESSCSCSTSRSSDRSRSRSIKSSRHEKPIQAPVTPNEEQAYYEHGVNAALELDAALMADSYRLHQIQQLMLYSALMAGNEVAEVNALQEESQISDVDFTEPQLDKKSISSHASSLNSEDGDSECSEILQISLSSATSTSSKNDGRKNLRKKRMKKNERLKQTESAGNVNGDILELDSDSSEASASPNDAIQVKSGDCICIDSETDNDTNTDQQSGSESSTSETQSGMENNTNDICHTAVETVTLLSSSDSEVEIVSDNDAKATVQEEQGSHAPCLMKITKENPKETLNLSSSTKKIVEPESLMSLENNVSNTLISAFPDCPTLICLEQMQRIDRILGKESTAVHDVNTEATKPSPYSPTICSVESTPSSDAKSKSDISLGETDGKSILSIQTATVMGASMYESATLDPHIDTVASDSHSNSSTICTDKALPSNTIVIDIDAAEESIDSSNILNPSTSFLHKNDIISSAESCALVSPTVYASESKSPLSSSLEEGNHVSNTTEVPPSFSDFSQSDPSHNACLEVLESPLPLLALTTPIVTATIQNTVNIQNDNNSTTTSEPISEQKSSLDKSPDSAPP
ncbi:PREDICTED: uncharacterized threonine-rich GPI-anchored glycoprotein PJ4664.02 isoform X2 [Rhagoletis zephyria]|uniref:uncharacterized threonine-rich GPI-anchored glycoprotein PJ4664.02 isoform X2 n=1 Tax=Rhagoletis zephyria TaxID=28612 RepID=UPI00081192C4|nr:PREDICTED: uncharacterized threonine-rich GPI-anchored glycoprotein PJ4664.02 isoform X2 [Rhagoletis zephyria]